MTEPSKLDQATTAAVNMQRGSWHALVDVAVLLAEDRTDGAATELSKHMRQGKDSLKRKINAILDCRMRVQPTIQAINETITDGTTAP